MLGLDHTSHGACQHVDVSTLEYFINYCSYYMRTEYSLAFIVIPVPNGPVHWNRMPSRVFSPFYQCLHVFFSGS